MDVTYDDVLADVEARDARDMARDAAPLVAAPDAIEIDTTQMPIADAVARAIVVIKAAM